MASLWMKSINSPNFILPISFTSAIRQTLTPPNIPTIWHIASWTLSSSLLLYALDNIDNYISKICVHIYLGMIK